MSHVAFDNQSNASNKSSAASARCAGYAVYDPLGQRIGKAREIFVNSEGEPEYLSVQISRFGAKAVLIPVQFVEEDEERQILVLK